MTEPALTPEEWSEFLVPERWQGGRVEGRTLFVASDCGGEPYAEEVELDAHETAAKCLHGQPFGFTREMVRAVRSCAKNVQNEWREFGYTDPHPKAALASLAADRIEALLPPEEKS